MMRRVKVTALVVVAVIWLTGCANGKGEDFKDMLINLDQIDSAGEKNAQTETGEAVVIYDNPFTEEMTAE